MKSVDAQVNEALARKIGNLVIQVTLLETQLADALSLLAKSRVEDTRGDGQ